MELAEVRTEIMKLRGQITDTSRNIDRGKAHVAQTLIAGALKLVEQIASGNPSPKVELRVEAVTIVNGMAMILVRWLQPMLAEHGNIGLTFFSFAGDGDLHFERTKRA